MNNFNLKELLVQLELQLIQAKSQVETLEKQINLIKSQEDKKSN